MALVEVVEEEAGAAHLAVEAVHLAALAALADQQISEQLQRLEALVVRVAGAGVMAGAMVVLA